MHLSVIPLLAHASSLARGVCVGTQHPQTHLLRHNIMLELIVGSLLQVDKAKVHLRRIIGLKKDEYNLDGKHIT